MIWFFITVAAFFVFAATDLSTGVRYGALIIGIIGFVLCVIVSYRTKT